MHITPRVPHLPTSPPPLIDRSEITTLPRVINARKRSDPASMSEIIITLLYERAVRKRTFTSNTCHGRKFGRGKTLAFFFFAWHDEGSPFPSPFLFHIPRYIYIYIHTYRYPTRGDGWFELLARGYLSTPCKVVAIHRRHSSIPCASSGEEGRRDGRSELKWSHRLRECLRAQRRHPPFCPLPPIFHESPPVSPSGEEDSAANPRASRRRLERERRKPYSYATLPPRC